MQLSFEGWIWVLIASFPNFCIRFTFIWETVTIVDFLEIIAVCDLAIG